MVHSSNLTTPTGYPTEYMYCTVHGPCVQHTCISHAGHTPPLSPEGPMVIDFDSLKKPVVTLTGEGQVGVARHVAPMEVRTPSILKIVLLQAEATPTSEASSAPQDKAMDAISLSGVVLHYSQGVWKVAEGYDYHTIPKQSVENIEGFTIKGGIRVLYSHTHHRWYVLPPLHQPVVPAAASLTPESAASSPAR